MPSQRRRAIASRLRRIRRDVVRLEAVGTREARKQMRELRKEIVSFFVSSVKEGGSIRRADIGVTERIDDFLRKMNVSLIETRASATILGTEGVTGVAEISGIIVPTISASPELIAASALDDLALDGISGALRSRIRREIRSVALGGQTQFEAIQSIDEFLGTRSQTGVTFRAETIARTEVNRVFSTAGHERMKQVAEIEPQAQKIWQATDDDRVRETHLGADGQIRLVNEPFIVGGAELMHPSDPNGPPQEVINCRCADSLIFPEDAENEEFVNDITLGPARIAEIRELQAA